MKNSFFTCSIILLINLHANAQNKYPDERYVFINANVITMQDQNIVRDARVFVNQGKIESIGDDNTMVPEGYIILDMEGKFLMPGMIDVHTHISSMASAKIALHSGVTTVRSASTGLYQDVTISELVNFGLLPGPDMVPTGVFVTPELGESVLADKRLGVLMSGVNSEDELRHLVKINIDRGVKFIKARGTERAGLPDTDPRKQTYTEAQLKIVVDEAGKSNVGVMIHAHGDEGALAAVNAGAKSIEHGTFLSEETLKVMKQKGTFFVPTYITLVDLIEPGGDYDNPVIHMRGKYMVPKSEEAIRNAIKLRVKIATGADNGYTSLSTSRVSMEVEHFVRMGMNTYDGIKTTTVNAAELLGLSEMTGRISAGFEADIIAVVNNPLDDIKTLQDVVMVMSNGNLVFNRLPFGK